MTSADQDKEKPQPEYNTSESQLQQRVQALEKARPWCSTDENLYDAKRELKESALLRWRPRFLRWIGATSKTGWDWAELLIVPLTLSLVAWSLGAINDSVQRKIATSSQRDLILREYFNSIGGLVRQADQQQSSNRNDDVGSQKGLARALTLTTLAQLSGDQKDPQRRTLVFQFLKEANLKILSGSDKKDDWGINFHRYDLTRTDMTRLDFTWAWFQEANLSGASLAGSNLQDAVFKDAKLYNANLYRAKLSRAMLIGADLSKADLREADLSWALLKNAVLDDADLTNANFTNADLSGVRWNRGTRWPRNRAAFADASLSADLREYLGK